MFGRRVGLTLLDDVMKKIDTSTFISVSSMCWNVVSTKYIQFQEWDPFLDLLANESTFIYANLQHRNSMHWFKVELRGQVNMYPVQFYSAFSKFLIMINNCKRTIKDLLAQANFVGLSRFMI